MLLLTFKAVDAPNVSAILSGEYPDPKVEIEAMATYLPLGEALIAVREYEAAFNAWSERTTRSYFLIGVDSIQSLSPAQRSAGRLQMIEEHLALQAASFRRRVATRAP